MIAEAVLGMFGLAALGARGAKRGGIDGVCLRRR
jgi:hypothetical protein